MVIAMIDDKSTETAQMDADVFQLVKEFVLDTIHRIAPHKDRILECLADILECLTHMQVRPAWQRVSTILPVGTFQSMMEVRCYIPP